jgi:hypothetical protein
MEILSSLVRGAESTAAFSFRFIDRAKEKSQLSQSSYCRERS